MEYSAYCATIQSATWLRRLLQDIRIVRHASDLVIVFTDGISILADVKDTKHLIMAKQSTSKFPVTA